MPLSTNAPFNEFGNSMVLRDIEQLYLLLGQQGTGSAGDGATQDAVVGQSQEVPQSGAGNSPLATQSDVSDSGIATPVSIANGGTAATTAAGARTNLGLGTDATGSNLSALTNAVTARTNIGLTYGTVTVLSTGAYTASYTGRMAIIAGGGGGGGGVRVAGTTKLGYIASSSGGSPTVELNQYSNGGGGGSGALVFAEFDIASGEAFSVSVGAGGTSGNDGNPSTFTNLASTVNISAGGGYRGRSLQILGSEGGLPFVNIDQGRHPSVFLCAGGPGERPIQYISAGSDSLKQTDGAYGVYIPFNAGVVTACGGGGGSDSAGASAGSGENGFIIALTT